MVSCALVLLMLCLWDRLNETSGQHCVDQPERIESQEGKSITIPCQFSFPQSGKITKSSIIVKASKKNYCDGDNSVIYNSSQEIDSPRYQDRLQVKWDLSHRNISITINNVTKEDATKYCCRIELQLGERYEQWQKPEGTQLIVKDRNEPSLETIPVVVAALQENVMLLGHFTSNGVSSASNITCYIVRTTDPITDCASSTNFRNCTYSNNSLSFQISEVTSEDQGFYCWKVLISRNDGETKTYLYNGPQLQIINKTKELNIIQSEEVEFDRSAILNCSFTVQQKNDILLTEVYWMIGSSRETYVYHPNPHYIHPDYKGKTSLVNESNLLLQDFRGLNNTIFYCRVTIRQCLEPLGDSRNRRVTILEEGLGTHLIIKDEIPMKDSLRILPVALGAAFILLIIIIILAIYFSRKRGQRLSSFG
ncbi:uncharacterized protein [Pyxicephalus adspersus]|uniref:uncharacterized protein isoform X2 n=1 Tax=Pyxicephalus adspersus TaxID=30357 RepID=UPI003B5A0208